MKKETKKASLSKKTSGSKTKTNLNVSPSAWMVWEKCALSLQSVKSPFQLERDEYAKAGTILHEAIAKTLKNETVTFEDSDDAAMVRFAVETVKNEIGSMDLPFIMIEESFGHAVNGVNFYGTPDLRVINEDDTALVIDYKTGWREVEAEGNSQLKIYAHIIAAGNKHVKRWKGI